MPLLPLLIPFLLLAFLLLMERVEDVLLGQHPDEEEAARLQRDTEAGEVRAVAPLRTRRLLDARDRAERPRPVRPVDEAGSELQRKSA